MTFDQLAKHTHRRGVLAAIAALAFPASTRAQLGGCAETGEPCSLWVPCCSGTCSRQLFNPNAGVCGGGAFDEDEAERDEEPQAVVCDDLVAEYDTDGDGRINCVDFACQRDAQAFLRLHPHDPCGLDSRSQGKRGKPCESRPATCPPNRPSPPRDAGDGADGGSVSLVSKEPEA